MTYPPNAVQQCQALEFMVARQPIFSKNLELFGYELLFRVCANDGCAFIQDYDDATNKIIADGFALAAKGLPQKVRLSVNVGDDNILSRYVLALPPERVLLEIPCKAAYSAEYLAACKDLRQAGYSFLLDNYQAEYAQASAELLPLMQYVKVPVGEVDGKRIAAVRAGLKGWGGQLVASRLESWEAFEGCKYLGFHLFQGYFFSRPQQIKGRRLATHKLSRMNLLRELSSDALDMDTLVRSISADMALTVRLLHFVNSAAFTPTTRVDSLARAAALVGLNTIKKWALAAVLSDFDPSDKGRELSYRTLQRAHFLAALATAGNAPGGTADKLFLLGLLANVDAVLGAPMQEILEDMPLSESIRQALLRDPCEPLSRFTMLTDCVERADWSSAREVFAALGIAVPAAAKLYMQAGDAAGETCGQLGSA